MPWRHPITFYFNDLVFFQSWPNEVRPKDPSIRKPLNMAWIWVDDVSEFTRGYMFFWKMWYYIYFLNKSYLCVCLFIYFYIIWFMPVAVWAHSCRTFQSLQSPMSSVGTQGCFHWISVGGLDDAEWSLMFPPDLGDIKFYKYEIWMI